MPHLVEHIKGFLPKAKSLQNIETLQKPRGGFYQPPLYHGGGVTLFVRPRVKEIQRMTFRALVLRQSKGEGQMPETSAFESL